MSRTDAILKRLSSLYPKLIDLHLERELRLLEALGRPQDRLPPVIHVAGTNGKGSTIAYLRAFLEAAGKQVHVFNSPHLVHFNERIRLAGKLVNTRLLNRTLEEVERVNDGQPITFFEITTAAAMKLFAETPADYLLLEVGMGGTYDSTNIVEHPLGVVITPVPNGSFLNGITRQRIIALLRAAGVTVEERTVRPEELDTADEIFLTGNYAKVQPCTNYNGRALQPGPLARRARELYFDWAEKHRRILPRAA